MPTQRLIDAELEQTKRRLRAEAARMRRRIDARLNGVRGEAAELASWQTYVRRFPVAALTAAFGVGLMLSAGLSPRRWSRWLGRRAVTAALAGLKAGLLTDLLRLFHESRAGGKRG